MGAESLRIRWERRAVRELDAIPARDRTRIMEAVESLVEAPLKGEILHAEWQGLRRLRVGRYRIIYAFDGESLWISVVRVGHRRKVCR